METPWFASWFNSPYYHLLYRNRSVEEANAFIRILVDHLELSSGQLALDLACGKGRHARALARCGLEVTGLDLSPESIAAARKDYGDSIRFEVGDMRTFALDRSYDAVFNLFTSFGYFDMPKDNRAVLAQVRNHLNPGGRLIIDFLNARFVAKNLVLQETKSESGIDFHLTREIRDGHIYKHITFTDGGESYRFEEKVQFITSEDFDEMLAAEGYRTESRFGSYQLEEYSEDSPRLIIIATKLH